MQSSTDLTAEEKAMAQRAFDASGGMNTRGKIRDALQGLGQFVTVQEVERLIQGVGWLTREFLSLDQFFGLLELLKKRHLDQLRDVDLETSEAFSAVMEKNVQREAVSIYSAEYVEEPEEGVQEEVLVQICKDFDLDVDLEELTTKHGKNVYRFEDFRGIFSAHSPPANEGSEDEVALRKEGEERLPSHVDETVKTAVVTLKNSVEKAHQAAAKEGRKSIAGDPRKLPNGLVLFNENMPRYRTSLEMESLPSPKRRESAAPSYRTSFSGAPTPLAEPKRKAAPVRESSPLEVIRTSGLEGIAQELGPADRKALSSAQRAERGRKGRRSRENIQPQSTSLMDLELVLERINDQKMAGSGLGMSSSGSRPLGGSMRGFSRSEAAATMAAPLPPARSSAYRPITAPLPPHLDQSVASLPPYRAQTAALGETRASSPTFSSMNKAKMRGESPIGGDGPAEPFGGTAASRASHRLPPAGRPSTRSRSKQERRFVTVRAAEGQPPKKPYRYVQQSPHRPSQPFFGRQHAAEQTEMLRSFHEAVREVPMVSQSSTVWDVSNSPTSATSSISEGGGRPSRQHFPHGGRRGKRGGKGSGLASRLAPMDEGTGGGGDVWDIIEDPTPPSRIIAPSQMSALPPPVPATL